MHNEKNKNCRLKKIILKSLGYSKEVNAIEDRIDSKIEE